MAQTKTFFAAYSDASFEFVCAALRRHFNLPEFTVEFHDTWQHSCAGTEQITINVTRAADSSTIETWMDQCPPGVNWQIIAEYQSEPTELKEILAFCLAAEPLRYHTTRQ